MRPHAKTFNGVLQTVVTLELRILSQIPIFILILVTIAFIWYLSWAHRGFITAARVVTDTHTHTMSTVTLPPHGRG